MRLRSMVFETMALAGAEVGVGNCLASNREVVAVGHMEQLLDQRATTACLLAVEITNNFGRVQLRVTGTSMLPGMWPGDVVEVDHRNISDLKPGEIIVYHREGKLVVHRIMRVSGQCLITRGDCVAGYDPPVSASEIVGQVVALVREGDRISLRQSLYHRLLACILRRSDFSKRVVMGMARRLRPSIER